MARKCSELRDKMSPERRARNDAAIKQLIAEMEDRSRQLHENTPAE